MSEKSDWQEANRELIAEERRRLGDPPTAEEMLAYTRGELSESEEERIRDLIVAYPELARMYAEPFPDEPRPGDADYVAEDEVAAGWAALQRRLPQAPEKPAAKRGEAPRRSVFRRYISTAVAAALAIVFFGLYLQADSRARYFAKQAQTPRVLGERQELLPDGNRGPDSPFTLQKEGDVYSLEPVLINQQRYPHYDLELRDAKGAVLWTDRDAPPDALHERFRVIIPHTFLAPGEDYRLVVYGVDGEQRTEIGTYDLRAPAE
jgi:hypothetical protein